MWIWLLRIVTAAVWLTAQWSVAHVLSADVAQAAMDAPGSAGAPTWREVRLPHGWEADFPGHSGIVWYRAQFEHVPTDALMGIYLARVCTNAEVYLNGELVGSGGLMAAPVTRNCYTPQLYALPGTLLRNGRNEVSVRLAGFAANEVSARQRAAGLSVLQIGPLEELQPLYRSQLFWNITVAQIIAATIVVLGLCMLGLAALRRQDSYLLYFALFALGWGMVSSRMFVQQVPLSHRSTEILICAAITASLSCAYLFLVRLARQRFRIMDRLMLGQSLLVPMVLALAGTAHLLTVASAVYNLLALEFMVVTALFMRATWRHDRSQFWLMGSVLMMAVGLALVEIALQNDWLPLPKIHVIHFAMPLLFLVIGARLIQLFVTALGRAETANQELADRVAEKSAEIERSFRSLAELRALEAAQQERQRIASDLHDDLGAKLLTIVHAGGSERVSALAREALSDMRLAVRGLTSEGLALDAALAQWRSESMTRLTEAGLQASWESVEPAEFMLAARSHVQMTRALRETVAALVRLGPGTQCRAIFEWRAGPAQGLHLQWTVQTDQDAGWTDDPAWDVVRVRLRALGGDLEGLQPVARGLPCQFSLWLPVQSRARIPELR